MGSNYKETYHKGDQRRRLELRASIDPEASVAEKLLSQVPETLDKWHEGLSQGDIQLYTIIMAAAYWEFLYIFALFLFDMLMS